jgi:hypothetical protein
VAGLLLFKSVTLFLGFFFGFLRLGYRTEQIDEIARMLELFQFGTQGRPHPALIFHPVFALLDMAVDHLFGDRFGILAVGAHFDEVALFTLDDLENAVIAASVAFSAEESLFFSHFSFPFNMLELFAGKKLLTLAKKRSKGAEGTARLSFRAVYVITFSSVCQKSGDKCNAKAAS